MQTFQIAKSIGPFIVEYSGPSKSVAFLILVVVDVLILSASYLLKHMVVAAKWLFSHILVSIGLAIKNRQ